VRQSVANVSGKGFGHGATTDFRFEIEDQAAAGVSAAQMLRRAV